MTAIKLKEQEADLRHRLVSILDSGVRLAVVETIGSTNAQLKSQAATSNHLLVVIDP